MTKETGLPETLQEAIVYFGNEDNAFDLVKSMRWPNGNVTCPRCGSDKAYFLAKYRLWKCAGCKKQFSLKIGTVMEDSAIGLDKWLCAFWLIVNAKNGISSYEIHRALGVTQKTGWFMLHRIRLAMQTGSFEKMTGETEADETFVGGLSKFMHKSRRRKAVTGTGGSGKAV